MRPLHALAWAVLPLLLGGCDVIVVGVLASRSGKSSSSSGGAAAPDTSYKVWVASIADLDAEKAALDLAGGSPATPPWTRVLTGATASAEIDLATLSVPGSVDTVLIQCPKIQSYEVDGIELLGVNDIVPETGISSESRSTFFDTPTRAAGAPDGMTATSNVSVGTDDFAYLLFRFSAPIIRFRVSLWTPAAGPARGDVVYSTIYSRAGNQLAGGADVNSSDQLHVAFRDGLNIGLLRFSATGVRTDVNSNEFETVESSAASVGSPAVVIDGADAVIVGVTRTAASDTGNIRVRKYAANLLSQLWAAPKDFISTGVDRIEWNGLARLSNNDVVVAGGFDFGAVQGVGHFMRRLQASDGTDLWSGSPPAPPVDAGTSYWMAVATSGPKTIASTGDLTNVATLVPYTRRTTDNSQDVPPGAIVEDWSEARTEAGDPPGKGQAVGIDSAGNVYAGGYYTRAGTGRDMMLLRYPPAGPPASVPLNPLLPGDDEILDLALAADDSIYLVGYETVTSPAQGRNIVLFHVSAAGALLLKRTLDGGIGDDRAVSVVLSSDGVRNYVYVVGEVTVDPDGPGGQPAETDVIVRKYVR